jgi:predicted dehydrogenase
MSSTGNGNKVINVGLAGLGRFGKLHASILSRMPQVQIAAICDPVMDEVEAIANAYDVAGTYQDFDQFLHHPDLDCFFIVTPEQFHDEMALKAIDRGRPIFMEKPLATTWETGRAIVEKAERAGVYLQIGFVLRFEVKYAMLKAEIDRGLFGEIVTIRAKRNCSKAWFDLYGDRVHAVFETIIHDIDVLLWLLQAPCTRVYAIERHLSGKAYPDACLALLQFGNGAMATLETSWLIPGRAPANVLTESWYGTIDAELEVVGTKRTARIRVLESGLEIWTDDVSHHPEPGLWPTLHGQVAGALREEDAHFIEAVQTGAPSSVASLQDALAGIQIAESIENSAKAGREVILDHSV